MIFGAGALGSLIGALMLKSKQNVVFIARGEQYKALKEKGLKVSGLMEEHFYVEVYDKPVDADLVFLTVKAYDTEKAVESLKNVSFRGICSLQNGVGNEEILAEHFEEVVGGVTTMGANLREKGHVAFAGRGKTFLGDWKGNLASEFAEVMQRADMDVEVVDDIERRIWEKAGINAVINPLTALCRVRNGKVKEEPLRSVAEKIAEECEKVMEKLGFKTNLKDLIWEVAEKTALNRSSMLQDVENGRRTEIEFINGAFVREGRELGLDVTFNEIMLRLVRGVELGMD